ncbi:MAG: primosomal protein N', partial [Proteobacteria bacterium]|nr:primosomal protein N' [Pseudomonadota bacterium]
TPALESIYNAKIKKYRHITLSKRAGAAAAPQVSLIDLRNKKIKAGLSTELIEKIKVHLQADNQVLLFLNRRGYASVLMCHQCGWMAKCRHCDARMTLHLYTERLHCHHCGASQRPVDTCQQCKTPDIITVGQGTERIEQIITEYFPEQTIIRIDRDSTKSRGRMQELLAAAHGDAKILIGTQMLAKGHHFPNLTLVAILDGDNGLFSIDFRGVERMGQLLVQVGGRAGRADRVGEVIIQTHHPDHFHLQLLLQQGYHRFAKELLVERQEAEMPPFTYLALLRSEAKHRETTQQFLIEAKNVLQQIVTKDQITILGPIPAPMERLGGRYRGHLLLQAAKRSDLQSILRNWVPLLNHAKIAKKVRWSLDVDPQELT